MKSAQEHTVLFLQLICKSKIISKSIIFKKKRVHTLSDQTNSPVLRGKGEGEKKESSKNIRIFSHISGSVN